MDADRDQGILFQSVEIEISLSLLNLIVRCRSINNIVFLKLIMIKTLHISIHDKDKVTKFKETLRTSPSQ